MNHLSDMTPAFAREISSWHYGGEYAVYDFTRDDETLAELLNGEYVACADESGRLVGYFCYGASARIPTKEDGCYPEGFFDIGLGLRPSLCGAGRGYDFMTLGLKEGERRFPGACPRLTVARFNRRARALYEKLGFLFEREATHGTSGAAFDIMTRSRGAA